MNKDMIDKIDTFMQDQGQKIYAQAKRDVLSNSEQILMGYKGNSIMDCGYFYAPYLPLTQTPVVLPANQPPPMPNVDFDVPPPVAPPKLRSIDDEWDT